MRWSMTQLFETSSAMMTHCPHPENADRDDEDADALPIQLEKHRQTMSDLTDVWGTDGKTRLKSGETTLYSDPKAKTFC
jgi:hypothetical protein